MIFSSTLFLFAFLPAVLVCYYGQKILSPVGLRNAILLFFSYLFYLHGATDFLLVLIVSTLLDFILGLFMVRHAYFKRLWLLFSLVLNLGLLVYFKYANFFVTELNAIFPHVSLSAIHWEHVLLPIGISFFTFQKLSYIIDVYRGKSRPASNMIDFALYIAMFPQLIAGPIVRFGQIRDQLKIRRESWNACFHGILRFCWGLGKKVMIADSCGRIADVVFSMPVSLLDTKTAWLGAIAYALEIYFDFSAYSDMAIGLGLLFGFRLPENFQRPYSAISIRDFWRRWHMTLGQWFRDYLYIPLGGNRGGIVRTCMNLSIVCVLCGLWHGAGWTFALWGIYHGGFMVIERLGGLRDRSPGKYIVLRRGATLLIVIIGWVLFRSETLTGALGYLGAMATLTDLPMTYELKSVLNHRNLFFMAMALPVFFLPGDFSLLQRFTRTNDRVLQFSGIVFILILLPYCVGLMLGDVESSFIYYRF
ncbi:MAG: MBOAT family protein [Deltaproteobacteria bacterium]|nr:MBOAT family protein [Deltaproteobacteria bacterium]